VPQEYTPSGSSVAYTVPDYTDVIDGPQAWKSFADDVYAGAAAAAAGKADVVSETITDLTISANLTALDLAVGNVGYIASAPGANFTLNLTNAPTTNGKAITVTLAVVQGATGYIPSALQVAGSGQTIKWQGGSAPTPTSSAGKIDMFSFTLIRRGSAWTVLGSSLVNF